MLEWLMFSTLLNHTELEWFYGSLPQCGRPYLIQLGLPDPGCLFPKVVELGKFKIMVGPEDHPPLGWQLAAFWLCLYLAE